jgi:hypothetical protein
MNDDELPAVVSLSNCVLHLMLSSFGAVVLQILNSGHLPSVRLQALHAASILE